MTLGGRLKTADEMMSATGNDDEGALRFDKWEALGNDFVIIERSISMERARRLCDRRLGIGADGVLCVSAEGSANRMVVLNADGSRPQMCGNGLRCVAGYLARQRGLDQTELVILSDAGQRRCELSLSAPGRFEVGATMGTATVGEPFAGPEGRAFVSVDVGNPHAVSFNRFDDEALDRIGPALGQSTPGGVNVELARTTPKGIEVVVWERGVGRTQACGTGACAVAAAAVAAGRAQHDVAIEMALPGGTLTVTVDSAFSLHLRGPAQHVFTGTIETG